jgi:putative ABC transport system permease protein
VLALVAGAAVAHTLLAASRRHLRDVTVLAVLGATPGQVRATLAVTATATVLPVLLLGIPLGLGIARLLWGQVAISIGVGGDLAVPAGLLALAVPVVVVVALVLAVLPAARAAQLPAAVLLRAA